ncbi:TolC family protein [Thalassospira profundimaris]|uniref:TolC family protein n=1 Tax=Thalassospira profundimaris TaxID=502049 RepID=UPI0015F0A18F|nr:TolC family protein [Thalassospira profundimaris]
MGETFVNKGLPVMAAILFLSGCAVKMEPISDADIAAAAQHDMEMIRASVPPITKPLTLSDAIARALKYNLSNRVKIMESALATKNFDLAKLDMMPLFKADGGYTARTGKNATNSRDYRTDVESTSYSYSDDPQHWDGNLRFSFNILDFGISYLQAKQEADRAVIALHARTKSMARLIQEVRTSFWRVVLLERIAPQVDDLLARADQAMKDLETARKEGLRPPLAVLEDKRALIEIIQQLETMQQSIGAARIDLASLINAPSGTPFKLKAAGDFPSLPRNKPDFDKLELYALVHSSDYTDEIYNLRIARNESRKAIARLFPSLEGFGSFNADTNHFLADPSWYEAGARVSWNLFNVLRLDDVNETNDARRNMTVARRLAANMAVITSVHVSWQEYADSNARLDQAKRIDDLDKEISRLTDQSVATDAATGMERIRSEIRALRSAVARVLAYSDAQDAYGRFLFSLGLVPDVSDSLNAPEAQLSARIKESLDKWDDGDLPSIDTVGTMPDFIEEK